MPSLTQNPLPNVHYIWFGNPALDYHLTVAAFDGPIHMASQMNADQPIIYWCELEYSEFFRSELSRRLNEYGLSSDRITIQSITDDSIRDMMKEGELGFSDDEIAHNLRVFRAIRDTEQLNYCKEYIGPFIINRFGGYYLDTTIRPAYTISGGVYLPDHGFPVFCKNTPPGSRLESGDLSVWMYYSPAKNEAINLYCKTQVEVYGASPGFLDPSMICTGVETVVYSYMSSVGFFSGEIQDSGALIFPPYSREPMGLIKYTGHSRWREVYPPQ